MGTCAAGGLENSLDDVAGNGWPEKTKDTPKTIRASLRTRALRVHLTAL